MSNQRLILIYNRRVFKMSAVSRLLVLVTRDLLLFFVASHDRFHLVF